MFVYKCVPEPLSIVLNMLVYPFFSPKSQGTERVQRPDVVDEMSGETGSFCGECKVFPFAVLPPHLPRGDHRGDRNPDPSVGEHRRMVPVGLAPDGTTGRAALDAV
jgi:hypothetical protein